MSFAIDRFFDALAEHLVRRAAAVRELAVMAAVERWLQMEAAALAATERAS